MRPLVAAALLVSLLLALAPEGKGKAPLKFTCGVLMSVLLLRPLAEAGPLRLVEAVSAAQLHAAELSDTAAERAGSVYDLFIRRETEEYIWSAAEELGIEALGVRTSLKTDAEGVRPWEVFLRGSCSEAQKTALSRLLETELGIPVQRQHWSGLHAD